MKKQNTSHAVMAKRFEENDSLDDFPTPPWATRALFESTLKKYKSKLKKMKCLEPACNRGYMSRALKEYFKKVDSRDVWDYGFGKVQNFLETKYEKNSFDWVITNPPFNLAEEFLIKSLNICSHGTAILARTVFLESVGRYKNIFSKNPPTYFAQFTERVPMIKGRVDKQASTATGYAWFIWIKNSKINSKLTWIEPCRKLLEKEFDYEDFDKTINPKKKKKNILRSQYKLF